MKRISLPIESLLHGKAINTEILRTEFLIIGSGYGGAVAAMRLAGARDGDAGKPAHGVVVLERGKEYALGDFPYDVEDLPSHVQVVREGQKPNGYSHALFNLYVGSDTAADPNAKRSVADVLVGSGLGGTSLINANVAEMPRPRVFRKAAWPEEIRSMENPLAAEFEAVREHLGVTTRAEVDGQAFPKYAALQRLGKALEEKSQPATIAVHTSTQVNKLGVQQNPCTDCGNCVTGCNVGAKNTLDRNLLRLAKTRGARFYTGATVQTVEPSDHEKYRWRVTVEPTVQSRHATARESYEILAENVILAAGSLGSTEILLRSSQSGNLSVSNALGKKFSTNGDGLIMSYGQKREVSAIAGAEQKRPLKKVGPTITGIIRTDKLSIEEASIPAPLARVFCELVTTGAMVQRMADRKLPGFFRRGWFGKSDHDPLASSMAVADHCQTLLVMGDDGANGELVLPEFGGAVQVSFPGSNIKDNDALIDANELLAEQDRKAGLDGGQYVPNPLWRLLPKEAEDADVLSGEMPVGRVLTVHPLGGCAMADTVAEGVVNHAGQVFDPNGSLHDGLYVLDGAIIPAALEVNPFLTIAALAWRSSGLILDKHCESPIKTVSEAYADLGNIPTRQRNRPQPTEFVIQEQLVGKVDVLTPWFRRNLSDVDQQRITQKDGLVVQVVASNVDAEQWLDNPGKTLLDAKMHLYANPLSAERVEKFHPVGVDRAHLELVTPLLDLEGSFAIFAENKYNPFSDFLGGFEAVRTYSKRRGISFGKKDDSPFERLKAALEGWCVFWNLGVLQSRSRRLSYEFTSQESGISIRGDKVIGYSRKLERLWPALLNLRLEIEEGNDSKSHADLLVNGEYLVEPGLIEVKRSANLPQSLLFAGGLAAFAARCLFATNFWEFGGLEYSEAKNKGVKQNSSTDSDKQTGETAKQLAQVFPLLQTKSGAISPEHFDLDVPTSGDIAEKIPLILTRYARPHAKPILLLHGLAQSSQIYWTEGIDNLAAHFYDSEYDVWLLDYRLSKLILPGLKDPGWSMDEIASHDIPTAIDRVCQETKHEKILVFGHCVGAVSLAMAVLEQPGLGDKIEAAVTNAIHPWVTMSPANRFRAKLGNYLQEWVPAGLLDPNPSTESGALQNILDRLAFSLARINEQPEDDHPSYGGSPLVQSICDRMTFLYGRMWNHKNLAPTTHNQFVEILGPAPISIYQQLFYYSQVRRLTDKSGENRYLTSDNIRDNWTFPILFIHGEDSRVFNPHSAERSALRLRKHLNARDCPGLEDEEECDNRTPVHFRIYQNYGHMDVVFGEKASVDCFPDYVKFLKNPRGFERNPDELDWPEPFEAMPITGPVLRAAWIEDGRCCLRVWAELRTHSAVLAKRLIVKGGIEKRQFDIQGTDAVPIASQRFRIIDIEIADIASGINLSLRGSTSDHDKHPGAMLAYDDQAWIHRLRALASGDYQQRMSFIVGSCRFPGTIVDNAISDKVYWAIQQHTLTPAGAQLLFLVGDQIYADKLDQLLESKSLKARYTDRYQRAFRRDSSRHFTGLLQQLPTHFTIDDHEIDDNWSGLPAGTSSSSLARKEFEYAMTMAERFMSSGRNQFPIFGKSSPKPFHYALSHPRECDFPTFVADTRSERVFRHSNVAGDYDLFCACQYTALIEWLMEAKRHHEDSPKFIVSGSITAPVPTSYCDESSTWRQQDGWVGYPKTFEGLMEFIAREQIRNVIFVGGDAHLSAVSEMRVKLQQSEGEVSVWQIVSSGLYAPLPFANSRAEHFTWAQWHKLPIHVVAGLSIECRNTLLSDHYQQFVRVDADSSKVIVRCFDENNQTLAEEEILL